jgi:hypothetical protein
MRQRCYNPKAPNFHLYGARGIRSCARWERFDLFHADMGDRPEGMTLDRIENSEGYYKENCRWADGRTQHNNKRSNRRFGDVTMTQGARAAGLNRQTVHERLKRGWSFERATSQPTK